MDATTKARADWLSRRADNYCVHGPGEVNGADLVRIARTLAAEPWRFTQTGPATPDDPAGIVVDNGRRRVRLGVALAAHGCVFMIRAVGGSGRCGLGDLAPLCCRMFPADVTGEPVGEPAAEPMAEPTTEPTTEPTAEPTPAAPGPTGEEVTRLRETWAGDRTYWHETIRRWNRRSGRYGDDPLTVEDFQRYVLEVEAARQAGTTWPEEVSA